MKLKSLKRKSVASVPVDFTGQAKKFAASVAENIDTLTGRRGNIIDRAVTFRDLLEAKVLKRSSSNLSAGSLGGNNEVDVYNAEDDDDLVDIPPAPTSLSAAGGFYIITLNWSLSKYSGHSHVEIYRHTSNSLSAAETSGVYDSYYGDANFYIDRQIGSSQTFYYWIRAVNKHGIAGPFNSGTGTSATSSVDYSHVNGLITNILDDASSNLGFRQRITGIEGINTSQSTTITDYGAKYAVKIDNNGHVSGFGLVSTANNGTVTSNFIVAADRFAIARPFNNSDTNITTDYPFKVVTASTTINGETVAKGVYIDDAFIHSGQITNAQIGDAVITSAKISDLSAGKITSGTITIDSSNSIAIQQGKTAYNTNTAGFWLGNDNGSGKFHVGASATSYLKFDGSNVETTGLVVKDPVSGNNILTAGGELAGGNLAGLSVTTLKIGSKAVTVPNGASGTISLSLTTSYQLVAEITVDYDNSSHTPEGVIAFGAVTVTGDGSTDQGINVELRRTYTSGGYNGVHMVNSVKSSYAETIPIGGHWTVAQVGSSTSFKIQMYARIGAEGGTRTATKYYLAAIASKK